MNLASALLGSTDAAEVEVKETPEAVLKGWQCALCASTSYGGDWLCKNLHCSGTRGLDVVAPANCTSIQYMKPVEWLASPYTKRTQKGNGDAEETMDSPAVRHDRRGSQADRQSGRRTGRRRGGRRAGRTDSSAKSGDSGDSGETTSKLNDVDHLEYPQAVVDVLKDFMPQFAVSYAESESRPLIAALDIMLWACFNNDAALAEIFWRRCKAPVDAGLVGSVLCKNLSHVEMEPSVAEGLVDLATRMEHLAKDVLGSCSDSTDAGKILRRKSEIWGVTTMELALDDRNTAAIDSADLNVGASNFLGGGDGDDVEDDDDWQETFLAHRFCGPVLESVWCGDYLSGEDSLKAYLEIILQIVLPFKQIVETHASMPWEYSRFLRVPKVKFIVYYAAYIGFLTVYVLVLARRRISPLDLILTVWVFGLSLNEALDYRGSGGTHFDEFWNIIDAVFLGLIHLAMCLRGVVATGFGGFMPLYLLLTWCLLVAEKPTLRRVAKVATMSVAGAYLLGAPISLELLVPSGQTLVMLETVSYKILSCNIIMAFVRLFTVLMASGPTGVLVIIIVKMCNEKTASFMTMITALGCSFAVALAGLELLGKGPLTESGDAAAQDSVSVGGFIRATGENLVQLVWALVGDLETSEEEQSEWTSQAMLWVYMLVVQLLLANGVLIALLTDTYEAVRDRAYGEQVLSRLDLLHEFVAKHWLPPPLTLPFVAAALLEYDRGEFGKLVQSVTSREVDVVLLANDPRLETADRSGLGGVSHKRFYIHNVNSRTPLTVCLWLTGDECLRRRVGSARGCGGVSIDDAISEGLLGSDAERERGRRGFRGVEDGPVDEPGGGDAGAAGGDRGAAAGGWRPGRRYPRPVSASSAPPLLPASCTCWKLSPGIMNNKMKALLPFMRGHISL